MVTTSAVKTKFSQINDKRFYFPNGVLSLPNGHPSLEEIDKFKNDKGQNRKVLLRRKTQSVKDGEKSTPKYT